MEPLPHALLTPNRTQTLTYITSGAAETDDAPVWEAHGTPSRFSNLDCSVLDPFLVALNMGVSDWVDEAIKSGSTMASLAKYGVDMDHPCVRVFTKEEVGANRHFLEAAAHCAPLLDFLEVRFIPGFVIPHLTFSSRRRQRF